MFCNLHVTEKSPLLHVNRKIIIQDRLLYNSNTIVPTFPQGGYKTLLLYTYLLSVDSSRQVLVLSHDALY